MNFTSDFSKIRIAAPPGLPGQFRNTPSGPWEDVIPKGGGRHVGEDLEHWLRTPKASRLHAQTIQELTEAGETPTLEEIYRKNVGDYPQHFRIPARQMIQILRNVYGDPVHQDSSRSGSEGVPTTSSRKAGPMESARGPNHLIKLVKAAIKSGKHFHVNFWTMDDEEDQGEECWYKVSPQGNQLMVECGDNSSGNFSVEYSHLQGVVDPAQLLQAVAATARNVDENNPPEARRHNMFYAVYMK